MSTRINTNTTAMMASNNLNVNSNNESTDIQRLSTGLRINSAADDAAGLVRSQGMNAQLTGLTQATSNTNDAINLTKTAEGALNEVQNLLMSMRQLAVQASNAGVNDSSTVAADQAQITSAIQSIDRISSTTQFGTVKLLDGSATSATTSTAGSAVAGGSGVTVLSSGAWSTSNADTFGAATVTAATASTFKATSATTTVGATFTGSVALNGTTYNLQAGTDLNGLNTAIKASGYQATESATGLTFTATTKGAPSTAQSFDLTGLSVTDASSNADALTPPAGVTAGTDAKITFSGGAVNPNIASSSSVDNGDGTSTYSFSNGLVVQATNTAGAVTGSNGAAKLTATAGVSTKGNDLVFQVGANAGQTTSIGIASTASDQIGNGAASYTDANGKTQNVYTSSVKDINVSTFKGAQDAIAVIDKAISDISTVRASLGAFQTNVLQSNANSLAVAQQNLGASKSTITDADLAATVVQYTKDQILVQSSTSALSYANQQPQSILKLLQ